MRSTTSTRRAAPAAVFAAALALPFAGGCGDNDLAPRPPESKGGLYWSLDLNHHAVTLSTAEQYNTLRLVATPRDVNKVPLEGLPAPTYTSTNQEQVLVSPEGVLVAVAPTPEVVLVRASLTAGNLTHEDSVWVIVKDVPTPPPVATLSIHPVPPDSAKVASLGNGGYTICSRPPLTLRDAAGQQVLPSDARVAVSIRSTDSTVLQFLPGTEVDFGNGIPDPNACYMAGLRPGAVGVVASATIYGVEMADTVRYRIGWPLFAVAFLTAAPQGAPGSWFAAPEMRLGTGALVMFRHDGSTGDTVHVVIDDNARFLAVAASPVPDLRWWQLACDVIPDVDCEVGGTVTLAPGSAGFRIFQNPGTYELREPVSGHSARVIIVDESES